MEEPDVQVPLAIETLRENFGDCKPPNISRKITACVACRKQKVTYIRNYLDSANASHIDQVSYVEFSTALLPLQEARAFLHSQSQPSDVTRG